VGVNNDGDRTAVETIQVYATDLFSSVVTPVRALKAFKRVEIAPRTLAMVDIELEVDSLALVDSEGRRVLEPGDFLIAAGHDSRPQVQVTANLRVE